MLGIHKEKKKPRSAPKAQTMYPIRTQIVSKPSKNNKVIKPLVDKRSSEYFNYPSRTEIPDKSNAIQSKKLLKRPTTSSPYDRNNPLSAKVLNELTGKINVLEDNIKNKNKRILNLKLDKAFLDIEILNNQSQLHKAEKQEKGSYASETIYNLSKQIEEAKTAVNTINENNDSLLSYQRFLVQELNEGSSNIRVPLSDYSVKQKVSTEFLNAIEELRMLQLNIDKHNQVYEPYINKIKKQIVVQKQGIVSKQQEIKRMNQVIFTHYGKNIRRNKSETSSKYSRSSSMRRRNEIQMFYFGNLIAKNRSKLISDKKLLEKVDVTFSALKIGYHMEQGFVFQSQYTDDRGEICEGQLHTPNQLQTTETQMNLHYLNSLTKIAIQFGKKINTIELVSRAGISQTYGQSHPHLERKEFDLKDKMLRCFNTYWNDGVLVGLGLEYEKRKQVQEEYSIVNQYFR